MVSLFGARREVTAEEAAEEMRIAKGVRAYVKAALRLALGVCESEGGPTCILGDARRNVRLSDDGWAAALDGSSEEVLEGGPRGEMAKEDSGKAALDSDDVDEYPDL